ncbi:aromatic acid exporter family protein [Promicromonospora sp. NPDC060271]|uniref:FUSC family protein n=1 Tax=Promicromonospora sp. NPDC060271 TaxID=3347089 RepID=UPI00364FAE8B
MVDSRLPPAVVRPAGALSAVHRAWLSHPRWSLAAKGALAASLAWFVGLLAPEPFSQYPYYAPLGAVLATTSTVVRSVRDSLQSVAAVLAGALIARTVHLLPLPGLVELALVVGLALLCVGWRIFGDMGSWTVMAAIFVLILGSGGDGDGMEFIGSYVGLILVGASIGIAVNLLLPPLPLTPSELALGRLRDGMADQVELLANWLEDRGTLDPDEWERRRQQLLPTVEGARAAVARTREASRANLRVRYRGNEYWVASQTRRAGALGTSAEVVDETVRLLVEWERDGREEVALGQRLRPEFAATLRAFATALRAAATRDVADRAAAGAARDEAADAVAGLDRSVEALRDVVRTAQRASEQDYFVAGALIINLARGADALRL